MTSAPRRLDDTLRAFADRLFLTGGRDPGDDALPIAPARMELYRDLVRGNYRSMLRFAYSATFRLLDFEIDEGRHADLPKSSNDVIARFLQVAPSRTHSTREIADRFLGFFPREYPRFCAGRRDVCALMALERAELRAMYHDDDRGRCLEPAEIAELASESLDALLARTILRAPSASVLRLPHPVVDLRNELESGREPGPAREGVECSTVARGRAPKYAIEFATHSPEAALVFEAAEAGVPDSAENLAARWIAALPAADRAEGDEWRASTFAGAVLSGMRTGFFRTA